MLKPLVLLSLLVAFQSNAQSDVKKIPLSELKNFGVTVAHRSGAENVETTINLAFGVPKLDRNKCVIDDIELTVQKDGQFISHTFLADSSEQHEYYSSHIIAAKSKDLVLDIGARYSCEKQTVRSIFYSFGDIRKIEKYYSSNGLVSEI